MNIPNKANSPPLAEGHSARDNEDTAARRPYTAHYFQLPKLMGGGKTFVWPVGTEGFRRSGAATLGIHKYLGRSYVEVHVVHRDEARIEMSGSFPGRTSSKNMRDLIEILVAPGSKQLYVPGVFSNVQTVYVENYDFPHDREDRTHSIDYTVTFVRTTTGAAVDAKQTAMQPAKDTGPSRSSQGLNATVQTQSERTTTVTDSTRTFRAVASEVYGDADKWRTLVDLNAGEIQALNNRSVGPSIAEMPDFQLLSMRFEVGTRLRY
jgi:hypothetical protein